jgi:hypothetical protein
MMNIIVYAGPILELAPGFAGKLNAPYSHVQGATELVKFPDDACFPFPTK